MCAPEQRSDVRGITRRKIEGRTCFVRFALLQVRGLSVRMYNSLFSHMNGRYFATQHTPQPAGLMFTDFYLMS